MKRKIFIFGIMLLILSPLKAYAADQISMVCDKTTAKPGDQVSCDIKFSNENKFMGGNSLIRIIKKSKHGN